MPQSLYLEFAFLLQIRNRLCCSLKWLGLHLCLERKPNKGPGTDCVLLACSNWRVYLFGYLSSQFCNLNTWPSFPFPHGDCRTCPSDMASDFRFAHQRTVDDGLGLTTRLCQWVVPVSFEVKVGFVQHSQLLSMALKAPVLLISLNLNLMWAGSSTYINKRILTLSIEKMKGVLLAAK